MRNSINVLAILFLCATLTACGTIKGIGKDISGIGKGLVTASDKVKESVKNAHKKD